MMCHYVTNHKISLLHQYSLLVKVNIFTLHLLYRDFIVHVFVFKNLILLN